MTLLRLPYPNPVQAREAKQQETVAKQERKAEAREARREGHRGIRASLDRGADYARGRAAALARKGSGAVAPSAVAGAGTREFSKASRCTESHCQTSSHVLLP
jgi:hypothetical protein